MRMRAVVIGCAVVLGLLAGPATARAVDLGGASAGLGATPANRARTLPPAPAASALGSESAVGPGFGTYRWPVRGPVIRAYEPPPNPYSAGHRGIDIAAPFGTPIRAPADGTVSFAGTVAGSLFISIDHAGGIRTSYSWVSSVGVKKGQAVHAGEVVGATGQGHPGSDRTHLHFSARLDGVYIDPMLLLGGGNLDDLIHLAA